MKKLDRAAPVLVKLILIVSLFRVTGVAHAQTVDFRELTYSPLGNATLNLIGTSETGVLVVENIGDSGLDGVAVELPDACAYSSRWEPLPAPGIGDLLRFSVRGRFDLTLDQLKGVVQFERAGPDLSLAVELFPQDVNLNQMIVKDGFSTQYSGVIANTAVIATVADWPDEMGLISACSDAIANWISFSWENPTTISVAGGPVVSADEVLIMSGAFRWDFSAVHLEAAGISPIVNLDAQFSNLTASDADHPRSSAMTLSGSVPNPFNPRTEIQFSLARQETVRLTLHDAQGRLVKTLLSAQRNAGTYSVPWDGTDADGIDVSSGVYLVSLKSGTEARRHKVTLVR